MLGVKAEEGVFQGDEAHALPPEGQNGREPRLRDLLRRAVEDISEHAVIDFSLLHGRDAERDFLPDLAQAAGPGLIDGLRFLQVPEHGMHVFHRGEGESLFACAKAQAAQKGREGKLFPGLFAEECEGMGEIQQQFTHSLAAQPEAAELIRADAFIKPGMKGADIAQGILTQGKNHVAQAVRPQEGAVLLLRQAEVGGAILFRNGGPKPLPPRAGKALIGGKGVFVNVNFPASAAAVAALPRFASERRIKRRNNMEQHFPVQNGHSLQKRTILQIKRKPGLRISSCAYPGQGFFRFLLIQQGQNLPCRHRRLRRRNHRGDPPTWCPARLRHIPSRRRCRRIP